MITDSELRARLNYNDGHLPVLSGREITRLAHLRTARRRYAALSLAACLVLLVLLGGFARWEGQPRIVRPDIAYASGPTLVLPDGRIDIGMGDARAWITSRWSLSRGGLHHYDVCYGDNGGAVCTPVNRAASQPGFTVMSRGSGSQQSDGILGGLVNKPLRHASFTAPDGHKLTTIVIGFRRYPGCRVVLAVVPRTKAGRVPGPEHFQFSGS